MFCSSRYKSMYCVEFFLPALWGYWQYFNILYQVRYVRIIFSEFQLKFDIHSGSPIDNGSVVAHSLHVSFRSNVLVVQRLTFL